MSCITEVSDSIIVLKEKGKSARFLNNSRSSYEKGVVDGCLITDSVPKCDGFVRAAEKVFLVELKGKDVQHAVGQIVNTSKLLKDEFKGREIIPVIVTTRCPAVSSRPKALSDLKLISGKYCNKVILRSRKAEIDLDRE